MRIGSISFRRLDSSLIDALLRPDAYPHPVKSIDMIETHISWVILTGPFAYKVKKPIALGFLDFRDLESRRFYCEEELRLNRFWAPDVYLDVVPICLQGGRITVGGDTKAVEYAVRMRQFDQDRRLDAELAAGTLSEQDMDELAGHIARRHQAARTFDPGGRIEKLASIKKDMWDNLEALGGLLEAKTLEALGQWTTAQLEKLEPVMLTRIDEGFVRECHGDLHLSNLVRLPGGIAAFDCIEFSDELRDIDVMCDIGFLVMDLASKRRPDLAYRFLNRYLELTGDYDGMALFTLYFVYRCLVRAKVAAIRSVEREAREGAKEDLELMRQYCDMALDQCRERTPLLIAMHGLSGSGKTWLSSRLSAAMPSVRIRSDIERKRLFGFGESADSDSAVAGGIYTAAANEQTYDLIHRLASTVIAAGHDVILDASYLARAERRHAREVAARHDAAFVIIDAEAPAETLRDRIRSRTGDASEADLAVLEHQSRNMEPLGRAEEASVIRWDTTGGTPIVALQRLLADRRESVAAQTSVRSVS